MKNKANETLRLLNFEDTDNNIFVRQYFLLTGILLVILIVYALRLWHLQVLQGAKYRYQSENNRIRLEDIPAPRGIIFDRNGVPLVENRPAYHLQIIREDVQDLDQTLQTVAQLCEITTKELYETLEANKAYPKFLPVRLVADLDRDCLARLEANLVRLPGLVIQLEPKREYRWNGTAAHAIGYLSEITEKELKTPEYEGYYPGEDIGRCGVESAFERYLHGKRGGRQVEVDAAGRRMRLLQEVLPIPGRNLWLTIDIELQRVAEACLQGQVGSIVAMSPKDGSILALASSPSFDQEQFVKGLSKENWQTLSNDPDHPLLNRAIGAAYPPGSTYKPIVALGGLAEGAVSADTSFGCPGYLFFADRKYRCWRDRGHGSVEVERALVQSCDVYFYQTGLRLGVDRVAQYAKAFGLGEKTGLGLHGEAPGLIPTAAWKKKATRVPWQKGETLSIAIGQGFDLATPLQMALSYAAIANGGKVWQPYVVRRIEGGSENEIDDIKAKLKRKVDIDPKFYRIVQNGLHGVVNDSRGTAHSAVKDKSLDMAGKTGTAQVVRLADNIQNRKLAAKYAKEKERDHAWFVGYAPFSDPKIVVCAMVEHGGHGSSAAAPLVERVASAFLKGMPEEQKKE